jgi:hypothetical protein
MALAGYLTIATNIFKIMDEKNINSQEPEVNESIEVNDVQPEEVNETKKSSRIC